MSREILEQLKVGDKVWVEMELIETIDNDGDFEFIGNYHSGKYNAYLNHNNNFSLSNPNELTVRELCEWIHKKGYGDYGNPIELYYDCSGRSKYGVLDFNNLENLTKMVREDNTQRKEEIKKQIEELQKELKEL